MKLNIALWLIAAAVTAAHISIGAHLYAIVFIGGFIALMELRRAAYAAVKAKEGK
jgi:hypothetical protein